MRYNPFKSITLMGALTAVGGYLWNHFDPSSLGATGSTIAQAIGAVITVVGIRRRQEGPTAASTAGR